MKNRIKESRKANILRLVSGEMDIRTAIQLINSPELLRTYLNVNFEYGEEHALHGREEKNILDL